MELFEFSGYGAGGATSSDASGIPSPGIVEVILDRTIPHEQKVEFFHFGTINPLGVPFDIH